jgi:hypothetical protein
MVGVWWGDDFHNLNEAVVKGQVEEIDNVRFREAEKLGIDIRPATEEEKKQKAFKLNFFDDPEGDEGIEEIRENEKDKMQQEKVMVEQEKMQNVDEISHREQSTNATRVEKESIEEYNARIDREELEKRRNTPVPLADVIACARLFCRPDNQSEEEMIEEWKNNREKLITDYKRKRKDAKRRAGKNNYTLNKEGSESMPSSYNNLTSTKAFGAWRKERGGKKKRQKR